VSLLITRHIGAPKAASPKHFLCQTAAVLGRITMTLVGLDERWRAPPVCRCHFVRHHANLAAMEIGTAQAASGFRCPIKAQATKGDAGQST
jgi:hypothetical protein